MWQYFWPDMAIDFVKGLVAGGASLRGSSGRPGCSSRVEAAASALACSESRPQNAIRDTWAHWRHALALASAEAI